jgi:hypothetical protein
LKVAALADLLAHGERAAIKIEQGGARDWLARFSRDFD